MTSATLVGFPEGPSVPAADVRRGRYVCPCGYGLRVFGRDATGRDATGCISTLRTRGWTTR